MNFGLTLDAVAERRNGIGGSDAGKIMAGEWFELWQDKLGLTKPKKIMSDWQNAWRHNTEILQLDWYEHTHPGEFVVDRGIVRISKRHPFMRCTLDGLVSPLGVPINAKHLSKWTKDAREWAISHYTAGAVHEAIVCDAEYGLLSLIHGEKEPEIIQIDRDPFFERELISKEHEFWGFVERKEPPPDAPASAIPSIFASIAKLREIVVPIGGGREIYDLCRQENWLAETLQEVQTFASTKPAADLHAITRDKIKTLVPEDIGLIQYGLWTYKRDRRGVTLSLAKQEEDDNG